jgi:long-subunit acyl-CoA synthetase (AMP-forming)
MHPYTPLVMHPYTPLQVRTRVHHLACGLKHHLGIASRSLVGICGGNSEDWLITDLSSLVANFVSLPLDATASDDDVCDMIGQGSLSTIICSRSCLGLFVRLAARCPCVETLVVGSFDAPAAEAQQEDADLSSAAAGVALSVVSLRSVETAGRELIESGQCDFDRDVKDIPKPSEVHSHRNSCIPHISHPLTHSLTHSLTLSLTHTLTLSQLVTVIFSSGTTGRPKGTLLSDGR